MASIASILIEAPLGSYVYVLLEARSPHGDLNAASLGVQRGGAEFLVLLHLHSGQTHSQGVRPSRGPWGPR